MKTFKTVGAVAPTNLIRVGNTYVDVISDIHVKARTHQSSADEPVSYEYTITRYTTAEYLEKVSQDSENQAEAIAELSNIVLGGS